MGNYMELLETIKRVDDDIAANKEEMGKVKAAIDVIVESLDEFKQFKLAKEQIKAASTALKIAMSEDTAMAKLDAELDELKFKDHDLREILSYNLLAYRDETQEQQVKLGDGILDARSIILNAKLGKPEIYQERLQFDAKKAAANDK